MNRRLDPVVVAWVSANVIPFEAELRARLRRLCRSHAEIDDLVQDMYYRILKTESIEHIREPRAFVMQTAKNILVDRYRREAVVSIEAVADLEMLDIEDSSPSTERVALARAELKWLLGLVANLPERCREVFSARKIYGLSQRETADSLGISENIVEKEMMKGGKLVSEMIKSRGMDEPSSATTAPRTPARRKRNV